ASENRQILVEGVRNKEPGSRYGKFTIIGGGGANISGGSLYTNKNEKDMLKLHGPQSTKDRFSGAAAGQAEVLYRRNSVFRVDSIDFDGDDVHVVLTAVKPEDAEGQ